MIRRLPSYLVLATSTWIVWTRVAYAEVGQLDQFYDPTTVLDGPAFTTSFGYATAQTFTVGLPGFLSQVDLGLFRYYDYTAGDLVVQISRIKNGKPDISDAALLAKRVIPAEQVPIMTDLAAPGFTISVDVLTEHIAVSPGDKLAIWFYQEDPEFRTYGWWHTPQNSFQSYSGGSVYDTLFRVGGPVESLDDVPPIDAQFRTFVYTPEPSAFTLAAFALVGFLLRWRRFRFQ